jgi:hypothetical protein
LLVNIGGQVAHDVHSARWVRAGSDVNRKLRELPDRLRPHMSSDQWEQLEAARDAAG